jgi:thioredoxin-related protein
MKKILIFFLALFFFSVPFTYSQDNDQNAGAGGMQFFEGSWSEVLASAKEQNKYIFVDAFADWCVPCKWMVKNVFPTEEAGKFYNEHFIVYKLDMEKGEGIDFAKKYKVRVYPSYLFFNADGELVHRTVGSKPVNKFIEDGKDALNPDKQFAAMNKKYDEGERGDKLLYDYAYALSNAYQDQVKIAEVTTAYLDTQKDEDLTSEKNWEVINKLLYNIKSHAFKYLEENKDEFAAKYGEEKVDKKILNTKIEYYKFLKQWDEYSKITAEYADKYANDDWQMLNSFAWDFYENVNDKTMLKKAETWAKRSMKLNKNYFNTDTYASVLYKLGKYDKALKYAKEAIELAKKSGDKYGGTEELIKKIEKNK